MLLDNFQLNNDSLNICPPANTDNKGKLFVMLFADSEPFAGISLNLKPGYAYLQVIKLSIPRQILAPGWLIPRHCGAAFFQLHLPG